MTPKTYRANAEVNVENSGCLTAAMALPALWTIANSIVPLLLLDLHWVGVALVFGPAALAVLGMLRVRSRNARRDGWWEVALLFNILGLLFGIVRLLYWVNTATGRDPL